MKQINIRLCGFLLLGLFSFSVLAAEPETIGGLADILLVGTNALKRLMHFVCIVIGCILFVMAVSLFKAHRSNPKFVPLERPIIYTFLGVILVTMPLYSNIFIPEANNDVAAAKARVQTQDADAPLDWDYGH